MARVGRRNPELSDITSAERSCRCAPTDHKINIALIRVRMGLFFSETSLRVFKEGSFFVGGAC